MALAATLGFTGVTVYLATNQAFALLSLSHQYTAATAGAERALILAAGQAALAIHGNASYAGAGPYLSYFLVSTAGLIISAVMLRGRLRVFSKGSAYTGLLANSIGLGYYLVLPFAPALVAVPISISAVFLLIWYLQVGGRLWALGSLKTA